MSEQKFKKYVTLGDSSTYFHDSFSGVTVAKGETKGITAFQANSKRVKAALSGGHLVNAEKPANDNENETGSGNRGKDKSDKVVTPEMLQERYKSLMAKGKDAQTILKAFTLDELKTLATSMEIEVEADDTKQTLLEAIMEDADAE
jgi:hypothetical protein